jgi:hypothetical protein
MSQKAETIVLLVLLLNLKQDVLAYANNVAHPVAGCVAASLCTDC